MAVDFTRIDDACLAAFGNRTVTFTPTGGDTETLVVIPLDSAEGESSWPGATMFFEVPASGIAVDPSIGDAVVYSEISYRVSAVEKAETGAFTVECRKS